jgi:glycosyltransferase involved in cell wall biosynthesis
VSEVFVGNQIRRLVFIGRLEPEKSPEFFLKLCKASDISGLVMGTGSLEQELRILCQELKIEVEFLGFVEYPWGKCLEGDLVIVPSKWEGDGLVIVEALHLGLPILLADIPDLRRFGLPDQNYFPMKNSIQENHSQLVWQIEALGTDLLSLVPDEECRNRVLAERNPELITKKWIDLLTV